MKLVYGINDTPPLKKNLIYALQQLLAIMAATLLVPILVGSEYMSQSAALFGAGAGTIFYLLVTRRKSPVFLGSSFAFINPLIGAVSFGYLGVFLGAVAAGLVYVVIALIIKATGSEWVNNFLVGGDGNVDADLHYGFGSAAMKVKAKKGWSRIAYLSVINLPVAQAMSEYLPYASKGDVLKSQDAFSILSPDGAGNLVWKGTLKYMETGKGYMLKRIPVFYVR